MPSEDIRRNRVTVMLTDGEFVKLSRWAEERDLPIGTVGYEIVSRSLQRRK